MSSLPNLLCHQAITSNRQEMDRLDHLRQLKQPLNILLVIRLCRPVILYQLISEAGLKGGYRIGGVEFEKHAGFYG